MARKLRLEFPGACYHVINRGNYRRHVFGTAGAQVAFERCLFEACAKSGWVLHAFVIMGNHYHLAVETPAGNLVTGMQWLQATFANRFNRLRGERGHLFQGRYKALLVEPGAALGQVCHYLHLNPVRAGLATVAELADYRGASYWYMRRPKERPAFLAMATALAEAGGLADDAAGWRSYAEFLAWQAAEGPAGKSRAYVKLSAGWALGTAEFKTALVQEHALAATSRAWEAAGAREIREAQWTERLARCCAVLKQDPTGAAQQAKSAPWKVAAAGFLKARTQASNGWLARELAMGSAVAVSQYVGRMRRQGGPAAELLRRLNERIKT